MKYHRDCSAQRMQTGPAANWAGTFRRGRSRAPATIIDNRASSAAQRQLIRSLRVVDGHPANEGPVAQLARTRDSTRKQTEAANAKYAAWQASAPKYPHRTPNSTYNDGTYTSKADSKGYVSFTINLGTYWVGTAPDAGWLETVNLGHWPSGTHKPGSSGTRYRHKSMANYLASTYMDGDGHTWHHTNVDGELKLIETDIHGKHAHVGGMSMWGHKY